MARKTITIDRDAFERLSPHKGEGESFSHVIKELIPPTQFSAGDLLACLEVVEVSDDTLDELDRIIEARANNQVRVPTR